MRPDCPTQFGRMCAKLGIRIMAVRPARPADDQLNGYVGSVGFCFELEFDAGRAI